jgi:hypothetical protein
MIAHFMIRWRSCCVEQQLISKLGWLEAGIMLDEEGGWLKEGGGQAHQKECGWRKEAEGESTACKNIEK